MEIEQPMSRSDFLRLSTLVAITAVLAACRQETVEQRAATAGPATTSATYNGQYHDLPPD